MSLATRLIGKGATLGTANTSTTVAIAGIVDVAQPDQKVGDVDSTEYDDTIETFIPGWLNAGKVKFKLNYSLAAYNALNAILGVVNQYWAVTLSNGNVWKFQGYLAALSGPVPIKNVVTCDAEITLTTVPVLTAS